MQPLNRHYWTHFKNLSNRAFFTLSSNRDYQLYFGANFLTQVGFWLQASAQAWFVLQVTHSGSMLAILTVCEFGPYVLLGLAGGVVADRFDRRRVLLGSQAALLVSAAALAMMFYLDNKSIYPVFVVGFLRSLISCVTVPATQTYLLELVGRENMANAIALGSVRAHFARIIGPASAGLLIAQAGAGICFVLNALAFAISLYVIFVTRPAFKTRPDRPKERESPLKSMAGAMRYLRDYREVRMLTVALFFITFIPMSFATTIPLYTVQVLGQDSKTFGLLFSSLGVGSVLSSLLVASLSAGSVARIFLAAGVLGCAEIGLVLCNSVALSAGLLAIAGFSMTFFVISVTSRLFTSVEDAYVGRITVLSNYIVWALGPFGSSVCGWLSGHGGVKLALGVGGAVALAVAACGVVSHFNARDSR